ncbi:ATP-dependent DNA helicase Rep (plasmid) [Aliivibrio fischeri MJ11]|uniref:DNA 3'-5' helicase n=1 Tax=Aliivibrio fischeri (strain MJ11) TaxID=388396 RepID=B5EW84_ALIFM|nr:ATP-dependent DNA helicase Rep [Aliivibrio fischeri MJ11]
MDVNKLLNGMTERQKEGVLHHGTPTVITAGAGAGKTAVLTKRIAKAIYHSGNPESVVAITFTKDAANEMKERVNNLVGAGLGNRAVISTFHSFAMNRILRPNWGHPFLRSLGCVGKTLSIEFSNISIDHIRKNALMTGLSSSQRNHLECFFEKPEEEFASWLSLTRSYGFTPMTYFNEISKQANFPYSSIKELSIDSNEVVIKDAEPSIYSNIYFLKAWMYYDSTLRERESIDFDQVLVFSMLLIEKEKDIRLKLKQRYQFFEVDEFQDTNVCQYRFLLALVGDGKNLAMFGDIKQAIYSFRGSNCYLMANINKQFSNLKITNLPDNFRSTHNVVAAGNAIADCMKIQLVSEHMIGHKESQVMPFVTCYENEDQEAHNIVNKILALKADGIAPQNIGILYRFNKLGQNMENYLISRGVSYRRIGNDKGLYEEPDIRDIVIYLHLIFNPYSIKAIRCFFASFIEFGVTTEALNSAIKSFQGRGDKRINNHQLLSFIVERGICKPSTKEHLSRVLKIIMHCSGLSSRITSFDSYCRSVNEQYTNMPSDHCKAVEKRLQEQFWGAVRDFVKELSTIYVEQYKYMFYSQADQQKRLKMSRELATKHYHLIFNACYDEELSETNLTQYICTRPLLDKVTKKDDEENTTDIELMTIHASKGLEKEAIFIIGCSEESWWKESDIKAGTDKYEEELRLFYVALTRAIEHLFFTYSATRSFRNTEQPCNPLRFLFLLKNTAIYRSMLRGKETVFDDMDTLSIQIQKDNSDE